MSLTALKKSRRKGFTMIELVVVLVIVAVLAGIALVGYNAVIASSKKKAVQTTAQTFDKEYRALAAFDSNFTPAGNAAVVVSAAGDLKDANVTMRAQANDWVIGTPTATSWVGGAVPTVGNLRAATAVVEFTKDGHSACLELSGSSSTAGNVTEGRCPTTGATGLPVAP